jgi:uncharacterized protein (DUF488 family)
MDLFTIGYERAGLGDFIATLSEAGVATVIDVRDRPQSRRAGFSKRQFAASLAEAGIAYHHLRPLGTPAEGRLAHRTGDHATFWRIVETQLATPEAKAALGEAAAIAAQAPTCLACYEANWRDCHRKRVGEMLVARGGFAVRHLTVGPAFG